MHTLIACESEPIALQGLRNLLEPAGHFRVVAEEKTPLAALQCTRNLSPSLLLLDKAYGIHAVMGCLRSLRDSRSSTAAIVWGTSVSEAESLRFWQAGAAGVVRKTAPLDILLQCFQTVAAGGTWMAHEDGTGAVPDLRKGSPALTAREMQVMELVERGLKNKDIAGALGIRTGTVKIHLKHIFEKTGIRGRYGLALSGLQQKGLLAVSLMEV